MSGISEENVEERAQANHLFELLDRDDDQKLEFCDTMLFIFSMDEGRNCYPVIESRFLPPSCRGT